MLVRWLQYDFNVYDLSTSWNDVPGIYIYSRRDAEHRLWTPLYIGQTESFRHRLPHHERKPAALVHGATHLHAKVEYVEAERLRIESELIERFRPILNSHGLPY